LPSPARHGRPSPGPDAASDGRAPDARPSVDEALTDLCRRLERALPVGAAAVVMPAPDGGARVVAPSLPAAAVDALAALPTQPAANGHEVDPVILVDLAADHRPHGAGGDAPGGFVAAWMAPMANGDGAVVVLLPERRPPDAAAAALRAAAAEAAPLVRLARTEAALADAEIRYRTLVGQAPGIVYVEELVGQTYPYVSPQAEAVLGYAADDLVAGRPAWMELVHPEDRDRVAAAIHRADEDGGPYDEEYRMLARGGEVVWIRNHAVLVRDAAGAPRYWHGLATDVTGQRSAELRLAHLAHHDPLTGLPNRALFTQRLNAAAARARSAGDAIAVLFVDLDGFKNLNDGLGHDIGDRVLAEAGARLRARLRPSDTLARFGGDEFIALLDGVAGPTAAAAVADDLLVALGAPLVVQGCATRISASVGIAVLDGGGNPADLLRQADVALYEAKAAGRSTRAVYAPALSLPVLARDRWEIDLRQAMARGELVLHYQPEIDLATGRIARLEALVRWNHPHLGLLHPANFVRLAEETGVIVPLGQWVLREACRQARTWREVGGEPVGVSVNLSAREFCQASLVGDVARVLAETGLPARDLELHVGEAAAAVATRESVQGLRALGVRVAIDDFGKAYPSLAGLQGLEVDALRIDRSFVAGLDHDRRSRALVRAIGALGRDAELAVAAKGVETEDQIAILRTLGIGFGQGFALAPPMDAAAVGEVLAGAAPLATLSVGGIA
jgi:diguanylate cyclase (GGDEF)-like protein/PAS domain S-box-containing protein